ncbi:unnamed protein product, partial [Pylaiella littoralis]
KREAGKFFASPERAPDLHRATEGGLCVVRACGTMGNAASNAATGSGSRNKLNASKTRASRSPKGRRSPKSREVTAEQLCNALRDKGLCIAESDLKKVLAAHSSIMEAIAFAIDTNIARKMVTGHRRGGGGGGGKISRKSSSGVGGGGGGGNGGDGG